MVIIKSNLRKALNSHNKLAFFGIFLLFTFLFLVTSCSKPMDRSIFEKLNISDLKKAIDQDTLFRSTYKNIEFARDSVLKTELEKVKYMDLTYNRFFNFVKFANDTTVLKSVFEQCNSEWGTKYGKYNSKVDSILNYWAKLKAENSLQSFVRIELVEIEKEYYSYSKKLDKVLLGFKLTPLKGKIDQVSFFYSYKAKIYDESSNQNTLSSLSLFDRKKCLLSSPISKPEVKYWEVSYDDEDFFGGQTPSSFLRDYNLNIEIDQIRKNGKNISSGDFTIPKSIEMYWKYGDKYMEEFYRAEIVEELLKVKYLRKYEYFQQKRDSILKDKDPLSFELENKIYNYLYDKKYKKD